MQGLSRLSSCQDQIVVGPPADSYRSTGRSRRLSQSKWVRPTPQDRPNRRFAIR